MEDNYKSRTIDIASGRLPNLIGHGKNGSFRIQEISIIRFPDNQAVLSLLSNRLGNTAPISITGAVEDIKELCRLALEITEAVSDKKKETKT